MKTDIEYDGETYPGKPGMFASLLVKQYDKLNDEQKIEFENTFKDMVLNNVFILSKDKMDADMINDFFTDPELKPDFSNPQSIHNTMGLLNHINYVSIHGFDKFLAHDMSDGPSALNNGDYVFLHGSPFEQARQLKKELENPESSVLFQDITTNLSRGRIGFYPNAIKRKMASVEEAFMMSMEENT
jgi:hypothetical protein